ncbi:MAG: extracellular solute-binding protein [Sphaerochaeta sp.]
MKKMLVILTLALTSCSMIFASGASESSSKSDNSKPTITYTFRDDGRGSDQILWKWIEEGYNSWDKKDQVNLDMAPITASEGDYFTKIALQLSDPATSPDLVCEDTFQLPNDVSAGYLTNLDSYVSSYADWTDGKYYASMQKAVTGADGSVYGIPYCTDTRGLWYNRAILTEAGVIKQGEDWTPSSWDDILDACAKIQANTTDVIPFWCNSGVATGEATSMQTYEMLLYGTGERLLTDDGKWIIDSDGMRASLKFLQDIYNNGYGPSLDLVLNGQASNTSARKYFPEDKLAITLDGIWITGNWKATGPSPVADYATKFGLAAMPTSKGQNPGTVTLAGGWAFSIPENSDAKELTFEFIQHLMDPEASYLSSIIEQGNICTRTDVGPIEEYAKQPFFEQATEFLKTADFRPQNDKYSTVSTSIQYMVESVVTGTSIDNAISQYGKDVIRTVGKENVVTL